MNNQENAGSSSDSELEIYPKKQLNSCSDIENLSRRFGSISIDEGEIEKLHKEEEEIKSPFKRSGITLRSKKTYYRGQIVRKKKKKRRNFKMSTDYGKISQFVNNTVPIFTGEYSPSLATELETFIGCCENALECLNAVEKILFLRIVITRFRGKAYSLLQGSTFSSIEDLKKQLRKNFVSEKSFLFHSNDLKQVRQFPGKPLKSFATRVRELLNECKKAADLEEVAAISFKMGLADAQLRFSSMQDESKSLDPLIEKAERIDELNRLTWYQPAFPTTSTNIPINTFIQSPQTTLNSNSTSQNNESKNSAKEENKTRIKCGFCSKLGHTYAECRMRKNTPYCNYCRVYGHNSQTCKVVNEKQSQMINKKQNQKHDNEKKCDFCLRRGHVIGECRAKKKWEENSSKSEAKN